MADTLGARLRQRREQRQISLPAIADQTKIKVSLLEALERGDTSQWPSGIFRRAFVRAYAEAIGLDPDVTVREFLEAHPDPLEEFSTQPAPASAGNGQDESAPPPTRLRHALGSASRDVLRRLGMAREAPAPAPRAGLAPPAEAAAQPAPAVFQPDLTAAARLCTAFACVSATDELKPLLSELAEILNATGLVLWIWNQSAAALTAALAHGYSDRVVAHLPSVPREAANPTAAAFRAASPCTIAGSDRDSGALVVPLMTPGGCAGVLAIELPHGGERSETVGSLATIFAAQLATLIALPEAARAADRRLA